MTVIAALERVVLTLWVGALWTVGYLAAPVLFATLDDRALAGRLAGNMFTSVAYLSLAAGGVLLLIEWRRQDRRRWRAWLIVAMLALIAIGELWVRPLMAVAAPGDFARLHGIAQVVYLLVSLLGLGLVAHAPGRKEPVAAA
ncbi:MAG TPA: DUF4149 domain-containing protein [Gammaproteobacteria bacterium]|nr:DUF4149 domain-containing protein [Gammaproteobacteria bacterium]